ncbi:hypothetical protein [Flavobacterium maritimum]|uniref:hypothetical protein n=1 Tax=Flavobacterium maritimum TaxID=3149042 RepID=UPI0032B4BF15
MITHTFYFQEQAIEITQEIDNSKAILLKRGLINNFTKTYIIEKYNEVFQVFPYDIVSSTDEIGISIHSTELISLYYELGTNDTKVSNETVNELKEKRKDFGDADDFKFLIDDYVSELLHHFVYNYDKVLNNTKALHFFTNIDDEKIILMNLLNRYKSVLNDETKQISIFWNISLTKKISDIITKMLIDFIEQRLKILTVIIDISQTEYKTTYVDSNIKQIKWLGSQQEFCELIISLEQNRWIENINDGERKQFINSVTRVFDFENTKRNAKSNPENSLYQTFKGENEKGERIFPFLENKKYERKFSSIKKNNG